MPVFGRLFDGEQYQEAFLLAALCPILGYLLWWWMNRSAPVPSGA
jgi:drug/metabolite transporter superfamily protein YnfA